MLFLDVGQQTQLMGKCLWYIRGNKNIAKAERKKKKKKEKT